MDPAAAAPTGTVTFLLTDIEGSTHLWEQHPEAMEAALARHDALAAAVIREHGGTLVKHRGEGDSLFAVFARAGDAVAAAAELQRALATQTWPNAIPLRVRVALHTGDAVLRDGDYFGPAVNRCARLRAAAHGGQVLLSAATQELVREQLPDGARLRDLGECRLRDLTRPERVFQLLAPDLPGDFPPLRALDARPNNLPLQPTPLLGRERETAAVRDRLRRLDVRLVTLTGTGGTGKTRLGLQVAADLLDDFPDGVFFVDLAPIRDPDLVVSTIAQVLGVHEMGGQPLLALVKAYLREKQLLLLLDNFEQVIAAAPKVAELLLSCPGLTVLVTSREGLRLRGEQEFPVPPLPVPDPQRLPPVEVLCQCASVALFLQRAASARPDFTMTDENAPAVAEICARLEGLPLAIELAAARVKLFGPEALLSRLGSRLKMLTGGARDLPVRQQTLRDAIAWSYNLLDEEEKRFFRWLSVFVGGCMPEAAEAVCNTDADLRIHVLDGVASLIDKSLLQQEEQADGEPRFSMLETIREYGQECLAAIGEEEIIRRQHGAFFLALACRAEPELAGRDQLLWFERLEREHDNFRAALEYSVESGEAEVGLVLGAVLQLFWQVRGYATEGRERLTRLLALPAAASRTRERAKALQAAGSLAVWQHDLLAARLLLDEALAIGRELGDAPTIAWSIHELGKATHSEGDLRAARLLFGESLTLFQELRSRNGIADSLFHLGGVADNQGDLQAARAFYEQGLALFRELGERRGIAASLGSMAGSEHDRGDLQAARALYAESLASFRELGGKVGVPWALTAAGAVASDQGDCMAARTYYEEGLTLWRQQGNARGVAECLEGIARVCGTRGQGERAARLFGAAQALREAMGASLSPSEHTDDERHTAATRAALGEEAFAAAWNEGRSLSLEQAIALALQEPTPPTER